MPNPLETLAHSLAQQLLPAYGEQHVAEHNAWFLLEHITQKNRAALIAHPELKLTPAQEDTLAAWVHDIVYNHKPIQYILGTVPFLDLTIKVQAPTLIPRPETEEWCATLIEKLKLSRPATILDLCTGSGCIALALAQAFGESAVYASDISPEALELAQENARLNGITNVTFVLSDLYTEIPPQRFDLIVANPPYITPQEYASLDASVAQWEDKKALVADENGLKIIDEIIKKAPKFLQKTAPHVPHVWIEIGYRQGISVSEIFKKYNFEPTILQDLQGNDRVVTGTLKNS